MKHRKILIVFILYFVTFGIYSWYWNVKTKDEMNKLGACIPTAWIWLIPIVGAIWWEWKYCQGVESVTKGTFSAVLVFLLRIFLWFGLAGCNIKGSFFPGFINYSILGCIACAILQNSFNSISLTKQSTNLP